MARVRCVGIITNNFGEPIPQGLVCVERTNEDFTDRESVVKYRASNKGVYDFYIKAGYYSIYYLENKDGTREFMGNVHVIPKYKFTTCTVEELIEKFAVEVENENK